MWNYVRNEQEERLVLICLDELERLFLNQVRPVLLGLFALVAGQHYLLVIVPQEVGIVIVGIPLAIVAVKLIEALIVRIALRAGVSEPPFAEGARRVTRLVQYFSHCHCVRRQRMLALRLVLLVPTDRCVSRVQAGH